MEKLLLGTYTRNESKGIYQVIFDEETQTLRDLVLAYEEENPSYLAQDKDGHLFSVSAQNNKGGIAAFKESSTLPFQNINRVLDDTAPLCYVACDSERKLVFGANYHAGQLNIYKIENDGSLTLVNQINREGHSIHPNQKSSHVHYANLTPDKRLIICDLGTDEVILFNVSNTGDLEQLFTLNIPQGAGPRHLVFNPKKPNTCYLLGELNNTIYTIKYDSTQASLKIINETKMLPKEDNPDGAAAIRISQDGNFLYTSSRFDNSLSVFKIKDDTSLQFVEHILTHGDGPRDFNLISNDKYLVVGHQYSNNLSLFKRNSSTGTLQLLDSKFYAPEVVCIFKESD